MTFSGISDPETLEAMACREGLALASDLLLQRIMVASDCINAIRSIQEESMGQYGQITKEIRATSEQFLNVDFIHESQESNHDAHSLARSAIYDTLGRRVWLIDPPSSGCCVAATPIAASCAPEARAERNCLGRRRAASQLGLRRRRGVRVWERTRRR